MDYEGAYSQKLTQDLCTVLLLIRDNFKIVQDQKGYAYSQKKLRIYALHYYDI